MVCSSLFKVGGQVLGEIHICYILFMANVIAIMSSRILELIRGVYKSGEGIIRMPFGIIARCVQFVQFSIAIVMRVTSTATTRQRLWMGQPWDGATHSLEYITKQ